MSIDRLDQAMVAAQAAMHIEAEALQSAAARLNGGLSQAVSLLVANPGKIVVSGMGKSGYIAQKIAATFSSTGSPAIFLHPADAVHGDLGVYTPGDPTILISKSGSTVELLRLIPILREFRSPLIGILGNSNSALAREVDAVLDASVEREADPLDLAPTASAIVALALGDALAAALMMIHDFKPQDFARFHPGGQLGRNLWLHVADVMHKREQVACLSPEVSLKEVVIALTRFPLGAVCVLDHRGRLAGIITDGDVRRALQHTDDIRDLRAGQVMTANPTTAQAQVSLAEAANLMEKRPSQISVLPVLDDDGNLAGLLRIHDIYQAGL